MSRNNDHLTKNSLDYLYQQFNFVGKLEGNDIGTMTFISEKQEKHILNFLVDSLIVTE